MDKKLGGATTILAATLITFAAQYALAADAATRMRDVPVFQPDPNWPKLPNGWTMSEVSMVATDEQDNVWVLQDRKSTR